MSVTTSGGVSVNRAKTTIVPTGSQDPHYPSERDLSLLQVLPFAFTIVRASFSVVSVRTAMDYRTNVLMLVLVAEPPFPETFCRGWLTFQQASASAMEICFEILMLLRGI